MVHACSASMRRLRQEDVEFNQGHSNFEGTLGNIVWLILSKTPERQKALIINIHWLINLNILVFFSRENKRKSTEEEIIWSEDELYYSSTVQWFHFRGGWIVQDLFSLLCSSLPHTLIKWPYVSQKCFLFIDWPLGFDIGQPDTIGERGFGF
jgi:hypothetical protein